MRLRSASKRDRSKYFFGPHGIQLLSFVTSAFFNWPTSTRFAPLIYRLLTLIAPSSWQAEPAARARNEPHEKWADGDIPQPARPQPVPAWTCTGGTGFSRSHGQQLD